MVNQKYIDLLKKVKALAEQGVGGEKYNAEKALKSLMKKYSITEEMLDDNETSDYLFLLKTEYEEELFVQIVWCIDLNIKIYGKFKARYARLFGGNYLINTTRLVWIEVKTKLEFYTKVYLSDLKIFKLAFLHKNNLLTDAKNGNRKITEEERLMQFKAVQMAKGLDTHKFNKQLSDGNHN